LRSLVPLEARLGELEEVRRAALLMELRDYIQGFHGWNLFITQTFAHPMPASRSDVALDRVRTFLDDSLQRPHGFLGTELHRSGFVHIHGLIGAAGTVRRTVLWQKLFRRFGFARVELVRSRTDVAAYCTTYITKSLAEYLIW